MALAVDFLNLGKRTNSLSAQNESSTLQVNGVIVTFALQAAHFPAAANDQKQTPPTIAGRRGEGN